MPTKRVRTTLIAALVLCAAVACSSGGSDSGGGAASTTSPGAASPTSVKGAGGAATAALPDRWPAELALPAGTTVIQATETSPTTMVVVARIDGDTEATFNALKQQLTDAGYEIVGSTFTPSTKGGFGSISARGKTQTVGIAFGPDPTGKTSQVTLNVAQRD